VAGRRAAKKKKASARTHQRCVSKIVKGHSSAAAAGVLSPFLTYYLLLYSPFWVLVLYMERLRPGGEDVGRADAAMMENRQRSSGWV